MLKPGACIRLQRPRALRWISQILNEVPLPESAIIQAPPDPSGVTPPTN
jgi:hypothetical protein